GVEGVLDQLLHDRRRALDDLAGRDLVDEGVRKAPAPGSFGGIRRGQRAARRGCGRLAADAAPAARLGRDGAVRGGQRGALRGALPAARGRSSGNHGGPHLDGSRPALAKSDFKPLFFVDKHFGSPIAFPPGNLARGLGGNTMSEGATQGPSLDGASASSTSKGS